MGKKPTIFAEGRYFAFYNKKTIFLYFICIFLSHI